MKNTTEKVPSETNAYDQAGNPYVTLTEAASRFGVSTEAIRRAVQRGVLSTKRLGPYLFVSVASLSNYEPQESLIGSRTKRKRKLR